MFIVKGFIAAGRASYCASGCNTHEGDLTKASSSSSDESEWSEIIIPNDTTHKIISSHQIYAALDEQNLKTVVRECVQEECLYGEHQRNDSFLKGDSFSSSSTGIFSSVTEIMGNRNKYWTNHETTSSNLPNKCKGKALVRDRYQCRDEDVESFYHSTLNGTRSFDSQNVKDTGDGNNLLLKMDAFMPRFFMESWIMSFPFYPIPSGLSQMSYGSSNYSELQQSNGYRISNNSGADALIQDMDQYGHRIKFATNDRQFLNLVLLGSLGLSQNHHQVENLLTSRYKSYLILGDKNTGSIKALCSLKREKGQPVVRIFITKPRIPNQIAATNTFLLGLTKRTATPLYTWAEFRSEGHFPDEKAKYLLYASTGKSGEFYAEPMFTATSHFPATSQLFEVSHTTTEGAVEVCADARICTSCKYRDEKTYYELSIAKNIDVASIICFTAIIEEVIDYVMRKQCARESWKHMKTSISTRDSKSL